MYDLSDDEQCSEIIPTNFKLPSVVLWMSYCESLAHYSILLEINNTIRQIFSSKLQRTGCSLQSLAVRADWL